MKAADYIKVVLEKEEISKTKLAKKLGVTLPYIYLIQTGQRKGDSLVGKIIDLYPHHFRPVSTKYISIRVLLGVLNDMLESDKRYVSDIGLLEILDKLGEDIPVE